MSKKMLFDGKFSPFDGALEALDSNLEGGEYAEYAAHPQKKASFLFDCPVRQSTLIKSRFRIYPSYKTDKKPAQSNPPVLACILP